jgi:hypothetical protein
MRLRDFVDEALEEDRLPDGSVDPDAAAQELLQALGAGVAHLRQALAGLFSSAVLHSRHAAM